MGGATRVCCRYCCIAGQAIARGLILITHNLREFEGVFGVHPKDWEHPRV
jgi:predicted nucleic acid-binding protein